MHFSRRYPGLESDKMTDQLGQKVAVALEGMLVGFTDITFLPSFNLEMEGSFEEVEHGVDG